jgi:predicted O-linked N-acetylglucosamine transferase (SPINDLY family)
MARHAPVVRTRSASPSSAVLDQAVAAHREGRYEEAERGYRRVLRKQPRHSDAWHLLGVVAYEQGDHTVAEERIRRALNFGPGDPSVWNNLGRALAAQGRTDEAVRAYQRALDRDPNYADAHLNLGCALQRRGDLTEAMGAFLRTIVLAPSIAIAHTNLGAALGELGFPAEAEKSHRQALAIDPALPEAHNNLGIALRDQGRLGEAVESYRRALASRPTLAEAHANLGNALTDLADFDGAAVAYDTALAHGLDNADLHHNRGQAMQNQGRLPEAAAAWRRSLEIAPDAARAIRLAAMLPVIPESSEALRAARARFAEGIDELLASDIVLPPFDVPLVTPNFYLAYQAMDDRALQEKMAALYLKACPALGWQAPNLGERADRDGRLRVGIVSRYLAGHTIGKLMRGFVEELDRERFEVVVIDAGAPPDDMAAAIAAAADRAIRVPRRLGEARQRIADLALDLLFYPDIGMDAFTYFLAYARLAPAQLTTWGHPVTTGLPSIDWFVSAEGLEPEGADALYTERLARLTRLPTCYRALDASGVPADPAECRRQLGLDRDSMLYVCPQSLFKLHPENDAVLGEILRRDPRGVLILLEGQSAYWAAALVARFSRAFPDVVNRVQFLRRLTLPGFLALLRAADAVLDPLHWTGGNSTYEAFALGVPVVTWPGAFMRGRVTAVASRQIGVTDLIAPDAETYVDLAVRLAHDRAWREELEKRLREGHPRLFDDVGAVRELEDVFARAAT